MIETEVTPEAKAAEAASDAKVNAATNIHAAEGIHPAAKPFLFLGHIKTRRNFIWLPLIGMIVCVILGIMHPQKHPLPIEKYIPGSWAIWGFFAYRSDDYRGGAS